MGPIVNAVDLLHAAREAGAEFRLGPAEALQSQGFDGLPDDLRDSIQAQNPSLVDALRAELVDRSSLPWRRHGPGYLVILDPNDDGDGTRVHTAPARAGWALTIRPPGGQLTVIVARGTLVQAISAAESAAAEMTAVAS